MITISGFPTFMRSKGNSFSIVGKAHMSSGEFISRMFDFENVIIKFRENAKVNVIFNFNAIQKYFCIDFLSEDDRFLFIMEFSGKDL